MASYKISKNLKSNLNINTPELEKYVENAMSRIVRRYKAAGENAHEFLRKKYTIEWFASNGFPNSYHTMLNSLSFRSWVEQKNDDKIHIYFESYVDEDKYNIEHTVLYQRAERGLYGQLDPMGYIVEGLQWRRGVIGLPETSEYNKGWSNPQFHQFTPLRDFMRTGYASEWTDTVKRFL